MESRRFDSLARSLAAPKSRRGLLASIGALAAGAIGHRAAAGQAVCPSGQTRNRKGDCRCPAGTNACPNGRVDLKRDTANCGPCGGGCLLGEVCRKGECRCPAGEVCGCGANSECGDCQTCNFDTGVCEGACEPPLDPCTADSGCSACETCNVETGFCAAKQCGDCQECNLLSGVCEWECDRPCDYLNVNGGACYTTPTTNVCCADPEAICWTNGSTQDRCCRLNGLACQTDTDCCSAVVGDGRCNNGVCTNF